MSKFSMMGISGGEEATIRRLRSTMMLRRSVRQVLFRLSAEAKSYEQGFETNS